MAEVAEENREKGDFGPRLRRCRWCGLPGDVRPVFSSFTGQRWMLVGQAPGIKEQIFRRLFVGAAGRRLFKWLAEAGFAEEEFRSFCYITAVMKCFPGKGRRGDRKPNKRQLGNCAFWLEKELALIKPAVVIPVGKLAIERFLGRVKLAEVVGKRFVQTVNEQKVTVIPLPHPSGASVWTNRRENQKLIKQALRLIGRTKVQ